MTNLKVVLFCMFIILVTNNVLVNGANEDRKVYIIYMGSLPEENYSPQSEHISILQQVLGDDFDTNHLVRNYKRSFNGFAAKLTDQEVKNIGRMRGVVSVFESKQLELHTTRSWDFLGLQETTKTSPIESDMIIGVFDTGIWPESESFDDEGFGPPPKKWKGTCAGGKNFTCNNKIIGARYYSENVSARDSVGHGTHTASTAAGNKVKGTSFYGIAEGTARGGVPSARIAVYKICDDSQCSDAAVLAAFDDAIADGVDLISTSLGSKVQRNFTEDPLAIGSFHAMEKGILTVNSGGNEGPLKGSTASLAPWLFSVAASNTDRRIIDKISLGNGVTLTGQSVNSFTPNGTKIPLVVGENVLRQGSDCVGTPSASACLVDCLDPKQVEGKIVVCSSTSALDTAIENGAYGSIIQYDQNMSVVVPIPTTILDTNTYTIAHSYANSTTSPQAEILKSETINDPNAPSIADFSSRGPNAIISEIMKPDITAPGLEILAAYPPILTPSGNPQDKRSSKYNFISGTSMACPHVAAIAAYVKSFHPDWSPAAIKSSIMTTSTPMKGTDDKEYAYGSGLVNPVKAINPGLVFDLCKGDYINLLCNIGFDTPKIRKLSGENSTCPSLTPQRSTVRDFNYPALAIHVKPNQPFVFNFTRTVTNVGFANSTYKVHVRKSSHLKIKVVPRVISFKSLNEKQSFVVKVVGGKFPDKSVPSSSLEWTDGTHNVRCPVVVDVSK
ncbi:hypothetical protein TanjilG_29597 [Lupinus angustifolius]|uniref:Uncharacterized protein n=1 Tax=Lupinus angustifolius TaxID=3871 RepID=A0A4P1R671_LUPAN|nr:PREDICTED: subtilisin-like protease SBT4.3 [Lupinus angustifolius]OIW02821.1 hypothetical protein TanjilG_29597 [Lupinus angustifolius]